MFRLLGTGLSIPSLSSAYKPILHKYCLQQLLSTTSSFVPWKREDHPTINGTIYIKKTALERWALVEIVDAASKGCSLSPGIHLYSLLLTTNIGPVIGESVVTPSSIVNLLVKLRISPPGAIVAKKELSVE